jgi:rRNA maturation protein Nop10
MPHNHLESKANLAKLASYAAKLTQLSENAHMEDWVEKQITEATNAISTVYHFVEYESKFNDYSKMLKSDKLSEGHRKYLTNLLAEAKDKIKDLKKADADKKTKKEKVDETMARETTCSECGGTGTVMAPIHPKASAKLAKYKRETEAFAAAHRRMGAHEEEEEEGFEAGAKPGDQFKTQKGTATKTKTGLVHNREKYDYDPGSDDKDDKKAKAKAKKSEVEEGFEADAKTGDTFKTQKGTATKTKTGLVHNREKYDYDPGSDDKDDKKAKAKAKKTVSESKEHQANLAHHHATEYAKAMREGRVEEALHHKEKCEECGGSLKHGPMGEVYHTHAHLNGGQMYECPAVAPTPAPAVGMMEGELADAAKKVKKGALHKQEGIPKDKKIGDKKLQSLKKSGTPLEKKRANFALNIQGKGKKNEAANMWANIKDEASYIAERDKAGKKPEWLEKAEVEAEKKEGKKVSKAEEKKLNESADFGQFKANLQRLVG